ncbi:hypothetical protein [Peptacetobacter sp. AB800]|uniref:hypothetical protein n=1 Tax=Peptacetobacter sp. AB800 TaxID=3388428 RepID=UPI0039FD2761
MKKYKNIIIFVIGIVVLLLSSTIGYKIHYLFMGFVEKSFYQDAIMLSLSIVSSMFVGISLIIKSLLMERK